MCLHGLVEQVAIMRGTPCTCIVSCTASLSHAENESGETRIQFWFRAARLAASNQIEEKIAMLHRVLCTSCTLLVGDGYM